MFKTNLADYMEKEKLINYQIWLTEDARQDIMQVKSYILTVSGDREAAEAFSEGIRDSIAKLSIFAKAHPKTGCSGSPLSVIFVISGKLICYFQSIICPSNNSFQSFPKAYEFE